MATGADAKPPTGDEPWAAEYPSNGPPCPPDGQLEYWWFRAPGRKAKVVEVTGYGGTGLYDGWQVKYHKGEWRGPIPLPLNWANEDERTG